MRLLINMSFQHVQTINSDGNVTIDEFFINGKNLLTPNVFLGIKSNYSKRIDIDMNVAIKLIDNTSKINSFSGVYFPLESWNQIYRKLTPEQFSFLIGNPIDRKILLLPSVEFLYYGLDKKIKSHIDLINTNYPNILRYYSEYRRFLKGTKASIKSYHKWIPNIDKNLPNYVFDFLRLQHQVKTLFLVPPTPPIFDLSIGLEYAEKTFSIGRHFLSSISVTDKRNIEYEDIEPISLFLPISITAFKNINTVKNAIAKLERIFTNFKPDIIILKFFDDSPYISINNQNLKGLEYFSRSIIKYCKENRKLSGVLDSRDLGRILLYKGINFIGLPVNKKTSVVPQGGRLGPPPLENWSLVDPKTRDEITYSNFKKKYSSTGGIRTTSISLPYLTDIQGIYNKKTISKLTPQELTEFSKLIPLILVGDDIAQLKDAVVSGTIRTIIGRFRGGTSKFANKIRFLLNE